MLFYYYKFPDVTDFCIGIECFSIGQIGWSNKCYRYIKNSVCTVYNHNWHLGRRWTGLLIYVLLLTYFHVSISTCKLISSLSYEIFFRNELLLSTHCLLSNIIISKYNVLEMYQKFVSIMLLIMCLLQFVLELRKVEFVHLLFEIYNIYKILFINFLFD